MTSMILGALGAMQQRKIKRLLAYAAISHVGFLLIGLCSATAEGFQALFFNLVIYIIMTINAFAIILCPVRRDFMSTYQQIKFISDLSVLIKTNPIIAATLTLNLFSMAGIPPLAGFLGKYFLLLSAFNSQLYLVALVGAFTTVLSSVYYIRLIHLAFFERRKKSRLIWPTIQKTIALTLAATTLIITLLVYYPRPLFLFLIHANVLLFT